MKIKEVLLSCCKNFVCQKLKTLEDTIAELKQSANNETKSSVGDKYETGRAMIQLEIEKNSTQLKVWSNQLLEIEKINPDKNSSKVEFGTIVKCSNANYFISQACGKFVVGDETFFTISVSAPIFIAMSNKKIGEQFDFNGNKIKILEIV
jgi:transcription elongation GreA/GreB family factor